MGTLQGSGTFESPPLCAARRGWLGQRLPAHPCRCLHQHQIVSTRTSPFPAALSRQGGIVLPRKGRGAAGAGAGRCGDAPKGSRTSSGLCCAQPGLADPSLLFEMQKHKLRCFFLLDAQSIFKFRVSSCLGWAAAPWKSPGINSRRGGAAVTGAMQERR